MNIMNHWKRFYLVVFMIWIGCVFSVFAEEEEVHNLGSMVISATRTEIPVTDAPQSVTVLDEKAIAASPFERVEDIVRSVPGMYNFRHYGLQTNGIVSPLNMRGVGSNRVLLLVDGVPQNDNFNNSIAWVGWGHIPKESIERIEIVRGPSSAVYGSEGLGGVIHIITKKPKADRQTSARAQAGSSKTYAGSAFHSQKLNDFGVLLTGGYEESEGFYMTEDPESYEIRRYRETGKILGKADYDFGSSSHVSLAALYFDQDAGQGREFFHNDLQLDQYWMNASHTAGNLGLKGLVYLNRADKTAFQDSSNDNYMSLNRKEKFKGTKTWGADAQGTLSGSGNLQFTFGASYKNAELNYDEDYIGSTRDAGAKGVQQIISPFFNMDAKFLSDTLMVNLGARYDWIETSDGENWDTAASAGRPAYANEFGRERDGSFSPKLGLTWHPDNKTTVRASTGKGFRAPSLFELYKVHVRGGGTYYREANPDLEPEEIWSYDLGFDRLITAELQAKITFYQSFAKDLIGDRLIGTAPIAGGRTRYDYKLDNISEVSIYGAETELQWTPAKGLSFFGNYTWNVSKVDKDSNNAALEGNYLTNDPRHKLHAGVTYTNPLLVNASLFGNFYADIYYDNENTLKTDDYWTMDLALSRMFRERFTVFLNVENLFDKEYPIFLSVASGDTIAPGIIVSGGLKIDL